MIRLIVNIIVTIFLFIVSAILTILWLAIGTLYLIVMLLRIISLYTIALINSFISGTPLTYDYNKAIEEIVGNYINAYFRIWKLPLSPWTKAPSTSNSNLRGLLDSERAELKKSWLVTTIVFISYILSFGYSLAYLANKGIGQKLFNKTSISFDDRFEIMKQLNIFIEAYNTQDTVLLKTVLAENITKFEDVKDDNKSKLIQKIDSTWLIKDDEDLIETSIGFGIIKCNIDEYCIGFKTDNGKSKSKVNLTMDENRKIKSFERKR